MDKRREKDGYFDPRLTALALTPDPRIGVERILGRRNLPVLVADADGPLPQGTHGMVPHRKSQDVMANAITVGRLDLKKAPVDQVRAVVEEHVGIVAKFLDAQGKKDPANMLRELVEDLKLEGHVTPERAAALSMASMALTDYSRNERVSRCMNTTAKNIMDAAKSRQGQGIEITTLLGEEAERTERIGNAIHAALHSLANTPQREARFFVLMAAFIMLQEGLLEPLGRQLRQVYMRHRPTPEQGEVNEAVRNELSLRNGSVTMKAGQKKSDMRQLRNALAHGDFTLTEQGEDLRVDVDDAQSDLSMSLSLKEFEGLVMDTYYLAYALLMLLMLMNAGAAIHQRLKAA